MLGSWTRTINHRIKYCHQIFLSPQHRVFRVPYCLLSTRRFMALRRRKTMRDSLCGFVHLRFLFPNSSRQSRQLVRNFLSVNTVTNWLLICRTICFTSSQLQIEMYWWRWCHGMSLRLLVVKIRWCDVDTQGLDVMNILRIVSRVLQLYMSDSVMVQKSVSMLLIIPESNAWSTVWFVVRAEYMVVLVQNHFMDYINVILRDYGSDPCITSLLQFLSRFTINCISFYSINH